MRNPLILKSTSSGPWGYSVQSRYLDCSMEAFEYEQKRLRDLDKPYIPEPEELVEDKKGNVFPEANNMLVGSMFGELAQQYLAGRPYEPFCPVFWEETRIDLSHAASTMLAWQMYDKFKAKHRPDDFGEIVGTEITISIPEELFGLPVTGAIDFVSREPGVPGVFINDFKTTNQVDSKEDPFRYQYSTQTQCWLYGVGYHLLTGEEIRGIRHIIQTRRNSDTYIKLSEGLTPARIRWLQSYATEVLAQRANVRPQPSPTRCMKYHKPCRFLLDGLCSKV